MSETQCDDMKKELKQFLVQAICGPIMSQIRIGNLDITDDIIKYYLVRYLNICWHSFNKKDDDYVVDTFNKILDFNIIKGSVCLLYWIKNIGEIMIDMIDLDTILEELDSFETLGGKRENLVEYINEIFDILEADLKLEKMLCEGDKCDNSYDGTDLFLFKIQLVGTEEELK